MARCVSFVRSREYTAGFARCVRNARAGDVFCSAHRDAINGAMMGILHHSEPYHVTKEAIKEARLQAGTRQMAFESALATLNVPAGDTIRPEGKRLRRVREQERKNRAARGTRKARRREKAAATEKAGADRRSAS